MPRWISGVLKARAVGGRVNADLAWMGGRLGSYDCNQRNGMGTVYEWTERDLRYAFLGVLDRSIFDFFFDFLVVILVF